MKKNSDVHTGCGIPLQEAFEKMIAQKKEEGHLRTADNYQSALNKLRRYLSGDNKEPTFRDITGDWIMGFVRWLGDTHPGKPQTADFYFRNFRAFYNAARTKYDTGVPEGYNPFRKNAFREKPSAKRALSKEETDKLLSPAFRAEMPEYLHKSLDVLLFILFMRGMVFQDMYNLTWEMVDTDNHVHYLRSKTKVPIDTEISSEARIIMERYHTGECPFVFPFLHTHTKDGMVKGLSEQSALRRVNRHARRIGILAGLPIPLSTYVMRHTFATLMLEAAKPVELISQCLGHSSIRTTELYLSRISMFRVDKEVDDMFNRMLRPATGQIRKKKKKPAKEAEEVEKPLRRENTFTSPVLPVNRAKEEEREKNSGTKKYPFLHKKETCTFKTPFSGSFKATKLLNLNNIANFYHSFSPRLSPPSSILSIKKYIFSLKLF